MFVQGPVQGPSMPSVGGGIAKEYFVENDAVEEMEVEEDGQV